MLTLNRAACEEMLPLRSPRLHGCHRLRPDRPCARNGAGERRDARNRGRGACSSCRARWTMRGRAPCPAAEEQSRIRLLRAWRSARDMAQEIEDLLYDPQTSGGLLISLPEADAARLTARPAGGATASGRVLRARGKTDPSRYEQPQPDHRRARRGDPPTRRARWCTHLGRSVTSTRSAWSCMPSAGMEFVRELLGAGQGRLPRSEVLRHPGNGEAAPWRRWRASACAS